MSGQSIVMMPAMPAMGPMHDPVIDHLFTGKEFRGQPTEGFYVKQNDLKDGFDPFRMNLGFFGQIEVLFTDKPKDFGPELGGMLEAQWENSIGLIAARAPRLGALFVYAVHSAQKNHWHHLARETERGWIWGLLGGTMARSNEYGLKAGLLDVLIKAILMKPKWMRIARQHEAIGHPFRPEMGGGKGVFWSADMAFGLMLASAVYWATGVQTGADEGMTADFCRTVARIGQKSFMGVSGHPNVPYAGMEDPSPHTANLCAAGSRAVRDEIFGGNPLRILLQGLGNVGGPLSREYESYGDHVVAAVDVDLGKLHKAKEAGQLPIFDRRAAEKFLGKDKARKLERAARRNNFEVVDGLAGTIAHVGGDVNYLSPSASAKVIGPEEIRAISDSEIKAVGGAANGPLIPVEGSIALPAWALHLAKKSEGDEGVFNGADFAFNLGGADSVTDGVKPNWGDNQRKAFALQMPINVARSIHQDFRGPNGGVPPQLAEYNREQEAWLDLVTRGEAIGGDAAVTPIVRPSPETIDAYLGG